MVSIESLECRRLLFCLSIGESFYRGRIFNDVNGDGMRQSREQVIANFPVTVVRAPNSSATPVEVHSLLSASDGSFQFQGNDCSYRLQSIAPAAVSGWRQTSTFNVIGGPSSTVQDVGVTMRAKAAGRAVNDVNGNGVADGADPPLVRWTIFDDLNNNGVLDAATERAALTNTQGQWSFNDLPAGDHLLRLIRQNGLAQTLPKSNKAISLSLDRAQAVSNLTFASRGGVISGSVFNDLSGDGAAQAGEFGLGGWMVFADVNGSGSADTGEPATRTDANGRWTIAGLSPGKYTVRSESRGAFPNTSGANGITRSAALGAVAGSIDFGKRGVLISGNVFFDNDGDGTRDAGDAAKRPTVYLDANNNGRLDSGEASIVPDVAGNYRFSDQPAGAHTVRLHEFANWARYVATPSTGAYRFALVPGDFRIRRNFGLHDGINVVASVFDDRDMDGVQDAGEFGILRARVYLDLNHNGAFDSNEPQALTEGHARTYTFRNMPPGQYTANAFAPPGWIVSQGASATGAAVASCGQLMLSVGARAARISGQVFLDLNNNGVHDPNETDSLFGLSVFVDLNDDSVVGSSELLASVGEGNLYSFDAVPSGSHRISFQGNGFAETRSWNDRSFLIDVAAGQQITRDVAYSIAPAIHGKVFDDRNGNGIDDDGGAFAALVYADVNGDGVRQVFEPTANMIGGGGWLFHASVGRIAIRIDLPDEWELLSPGGDGSIIRNLRPQQLSSNNVFTVRRRVT